MIKNVGLFRLAGGLLFVLLLAGCQTTSEYEGKGRLALSPRLTQFFQKYLDLPNGMAFAASVDGLCGNYRYCPTPVGSCLNEDVRYFAVRACERVCNRTCKVLAVRKRIVWDGPVIGLPKSVVRPQDQVSERPDVLDPIVSKMPIRNAKRCALEADRIFDREAGPEFRDCPECPEMATLPAGIYDVGSTEKNDEAPVHEVAFSKPFAIGKYEVTFEEWDACVADGGCGEYAPADSGWGRGRQPVVNVSWEDAKAYVEWLSRKTGGEYRLPSEAEWEYAARAGACTRFWWGEDVGTGNAACRECGSAWDNRSPAPVGQFEPNGFGLHDTAGNVMEWVEDCKGTYEATDYYGAAETSGQCNLRGVRGGSWGQYAAQIRPENREFARIHGRNGFTGFRIAKTLP